MKEQFDKRNGDDWLFISVPRCGPSPWKAASVRSDSVFIERSNPGSPCRQVHCLSLCVLPIWLSTALQVARAASPLCYKHNALGLDGALQNRDYEVLWMRSAESVEDCNDIHNLSASSAAAAEIVFPFGVSVLMPSDCVKLWRRSNFTLHKIIFNLGPTGIDWLSLIRKIWKLCF